MCKCEFALTVPPAPPRVGANRKNRLFLWARKRRIRDDVVWLALREVGAPPTLSQRREVRHTITDVDGRIVSFRCLEDYRDISEEQLQAAIRWLKSRDICYYCGFDCTDMRIGFDCPWCGSN